MVAEPRAVSLDITDDTLTVELNDGRTLLVPLGWFPTLQCATEAQRKNWRLIGSGLGIHWPDLDEDLSVKGLLMPQQSRGSTPLAS